ncbi:MAG: hypothetical protein H0W72_01500, partial [Planctomycetes bacterium]|nr:hypothetical protein [Planctomycetota bacterium]
MNLRLFPVALVLSAAVVGLAASDATDPVRIVVECEDMRGVDQQHFGPGAAWQVGRWGQDLYQNMSFGGVWASRLRAAMTDASDQPAEAMANIEVPVDGTYKVWAKYEAPPGFNYAFALRLRPVGAQTDVFAKVYGLKGAEKHYSFKDQPTCDELYWSWGIDHDAAEGYEVALKRGRYELVLAKGLNPAPAAARSVDAILITSELAAVSSPRYPRFPMIDELRRANHVFFRFRNRSQRPMRVTWNHSNHRAPDYHNAIYRELVRYHDAQGVLLPTPERHNGVWPEAIAAGVASVWHDLGPTMNVETNAPFTISAAPADGGAAEVIPFGVDIALAPDDQRIVASFDLADGEPYLALVVQPDLARAEGVASTKRTIDIYREMTRELESEPRLGPLPKKLRLFGFTGTPYGGFEPGPGYDEAMAFRLALGLNTPSGALTKASLDANAAWYTAHGAALVPRSLAHHHNTDVAMMAKTIRDGDCADQFRYLSYGDEIALPGIDVNDQAKVEAFRAFVRASGETPESLGVAGWEQIKPLPGLSHDVAIKIGVLPEGASGAAVGALVKRLYWYSCRYRAVAGAEVFAAKTREFKAAVDADAQTTANLGGMVPFFWMPQSSFIESFKLGAMSLAWSEDYTYCQPEASRLVVDFEAAYLRKGSSYHDLPMMFYCMPHYPGNAPELLMQNAVMLWGQNVKDLHWYHAGPDIWATENYIAYRDGLPTRRVLRQVSGMAGLIEDHLLPARPRRAPIAMVLSESSDLWEVEGVSQNNIAPGSVASNVSQEERKAIWYALRLAGYEVDMLTEADIADGLLAQYRVAYLCGQNLQRAAATGIERWIRAGGVLMATAGAARKDEFDAPLDALDAALGRGPQLAYERYRGPLRAKLELLCEQPKDRLRIGDAALDVLCSRERFAAAADAQVLGTYASDGSPAWIMRNHDKGRTYCTGTLPGQAFVRRGLPVVPMGKGGPESNSSHFEPVDYDEIARAMILAPLRDARIEPHIVVAHRCVVANRLETPGAIVLPLVNLAEQHDGTLRDLAIIVRGVTAAKRVWSCFHRDGVSFTSTADGLRIT